MTLVLIVTRSDDNDCIHRVTEALARRGAEAIRFDTDRYPTDVQLTSRWTPDERSWIWRRGEDRRNLESVGAVWYRRMRVGADIPLTMEAQIRKASIEESRASLIGTIFSLPVFQMDAYSVVRNASNKQLQLQAASHFGLEIPRTLVSNDPDEVREFSRTCATGMIAKMLSSFHVIDQGVEKVVFTRPVTDDAMNRLESLRYSPMTFQENIPKKLELRITIVGDRVFTAAVDSRASEKTKDDWRRDGHGLMDSWRSYSIPDDVCRRLLAVMDHFQLNYGAIDMIVTPDNRHVFLEVNPVGEYFWLELCPGLKISEAIADVLLDLAPRRNTPQFRRNLGVESQDGTTC